MGCAAIGLACGDDGAPSDDGADADGGPSVVVFDARANEDDAASPTSIMRLAHLAPEIGPVDFCYRAASSGTFKGPVFLGEGSVLPSRDAGDGGADSGFPEAPPSDAGNDVVDAGEPALGFATVSRYLSLEAVGPITLLIVESGARSCANNLVTGSVTLDPGKLSTVALFGEIVDGGVTLDVAAFTDDRTTEDTRLRARTIHAALGRGGAEPISAAGSLAVRVIGPTKTTVLTDRLAPRKAGAPSETIPVDVLGYATAPPNAAPATIAIGPAAAGTDAGFPPWTSAPSDLALQAGSLHTAFILSSERANEFMVLWCADTTTSNGQTACQLLR